jgi:hypothetical protein
MQPCAEWSSQRLWEWRSSHGKVSETSVGVLLSSHNVPHGPGNDQWLRSFRTSTDAIPVHCNPWTYRAHSRDQCKHRQPATIPTEARRGGSHLFNHDTTIKNWFVFHKTKAQCKIHYYLKIFTSEDVPRCGPETYTISPANVIPSWYLYTVVSYLGWYRLEPRYLSKGCQTAIGYVSSITVKQSCIKGTWL